MGLGNRLLLLFLIISQWSMTSGAQEELEQDPIVIKGNHSLPKALYIAPWKRVGTPLESSELEVEFGEKPEPVERDLFQRELELHGQGYDTEGVPESAAPEK
ncbi:MAG: hypothetical protein V7709_08350 [Halioglobus sp.]